MHCEIDNAVRIGQQVPQGIEGPAVADRVRVALNDPIGFPPLAAATAPGDRVAIALADGVPAVGQVLIGAMYACFDAGVSPENLCVVGRGATIERAQLFLRSCEEPEIERVELHTHLPGEERACAMLGFTSEGEPIRLNRELCEADVVLTVGSSSGGGSDRRADWLAALYPALADAETQRQESGPPVADPDEANRRVDHAHDIAWRLGVGLAVAVVPAACGRVADVVAGSPAALRDAVASSYNQAWRCPVGGPSDLVIADLGGPAPLHDWTAFAAALLTAESCCTADAPIVVCSELESPIGVSLSRLMDNHDLDRLEREITRDRAPDSHVAIVLARVLQRRPVFLRSALPKPVVEALGVAALEDDDELERLASHYGRVAVLDEAQFVLPVPGGSPATQAEADA